MVICWICTTVAEQLRINRMNAISDCRITNLNREALMLHILVKYMDFMRGLPDCLKFSAEILNKRIAGTFIFRQNVVGNKGIGPCDCKTTGTKCDLSKYLF